MNNKENDKLILDNLDLVKMIALKIAKRIPPGIELDDLIHSGIIGLIDAAKKYMPEKGTKFKTYASLRVRGAILDELRNYDWASRSLRKKIKTIEEAYRELRIELDREPTEMEISQKLKINIKEYRKLLTDSKAVVIGVFRYHLNSEENLTKNQKIKYMSDGPENTPLFIMEREELQKKMTEIIQELPEKNKLVLSLYYLEDLNLKEIAEILQLTESRISQIRAEAIIKLKTIINDLAKSNKVDSKQFLGG